MAEEPSAPTQTQNDIRYDWIQSRVCSSIKGVTQENFQKLLQTEAKCVFLNIAGTIMTANDGRRQNKIKYCFCRSALVSFLEDENTRRLLLFVDGKDLGAVSGLPV